MIGLLQVFLLSLVPTFEGRYAIIYGIGRGYSIAGTLMAASAAVIFLSFLLPFALPFIDRLMVWLERTPLRRIASLYVTYFERVRLKARPYVDRWGFIGLTVFVAIPLPGTGIWTGALAAYVLGIKKERTIPALILGGLLSMAVTVLPAIGLWSV